MNEFIQLSICAVAFAVPFAQPAISAVRRRRKIKARYAESYLGEFVPAETPAEREQRKRMEDWRAMIGMQD
ncbi:MAG: hypothetical protein ACXWJW_10495 [Xanthobacteraceae bacterium]